MSNNLIEKLLKYPTAIGRFIIVIINNVYCIPTYVIWMGLLIPLKSINPNYYYKIEGIVFAWLIAVVSMWSCTAGYDIVEVGDSINECKNKRTLVIANHQSTADVPLLMANFNTKENVMSNIMWIMDRLFKFTNFGIISVIHEDFFIRAGRDKREESIITLKSHIENSYLKRNRKWMVLFPEGGFLRKRKPVSQRFAKKNNLPLLEYVTLPRVGALKAIVDSLCTSEKGIIQKENSIEDLLTTTTTTATTTTTTTTTTNNLNNQNIKNNNFQTNNSKQSGICLFDDKNTNQRSKTSIKTNTDDILANGDVKNLLSNKILSDDQTNKSNCLLEYILDITIAYPNGVPLDLPNILHGLRAPCKTYMLYRLYNMKEIPKDGEALTTWLYDRFVEKNQLLENFYKTGEFYLDRKLNNNGTVIQQDYLRFLLINIFFITSTYFHYQLFSALYTYCYFLTNVL